MDIYLCSFSINKNEIAINDILIRKGLSSRVDVSKDQSRSEQGPPIELIFTYPVVFNFQHLSSYWKGKNHEKLRSDKTYFRISIFGGKLWISAGSHDYIICSIFHGLSNDENSIRFGSEIKKLWIFSRGWVCQNFKLP